jgi:HAD superfamily hydrolase (TIGR01549 family)
MDPSKEGEIFWGLPVISKEQAKEGADVIVIVARKASVPIIYERIFDLEETGIAIVDVSGERVNPNIADAEIDNQPYFQQSYDDLIREIEIHKIITFDIFDTLIMRTILAPQDIFRVVEKIWNDDNENPKIEFARWRKQAEENVNARYGVSTYKQIYEELQRISSIGAEDCVRLQKLEYETERNYVVPRAVVVQALEEAWKLGKQLYLISDMYYSAEQLGGLLEQCGIRHYHGIVVSGEAGGSKWPDGELFRAAMERYRLKPQQILHIGDNEAADIECAKACGMDAFHVWNARKMLEDSYLRNILVHVRTLEDSIIVGMYMAKALNDPFALSMGKGRLQISSKEVLGYISYGPLLTGYLHWLLKKYTAEDVDKILFFARDGYLPEQMYQTILRERKIKNAPKGVYVLASRRCLVGASFFNEEDLKKQIDRIELDTCAGNILEVRFGINPMDGDPTAKEKLKGEELKKYLLFYKNEILEESEKERTNYLDYLHSLGIRYETENDIIFDSQTAGTSAYYYRVITKTNTKMECMLLLDVPDYSLYDKDLDAGYLGIDSNYLQKTGYKKCSTLNDSILTSPETQLIKIDEDGMPVYLQNDGGHSLENVRLVHKGIENFLYDYIRHTPYDVMEQDFSERLLDSMMGLLTSVGYFMDEDFRHNFFMEEDQFTGHFSRIYF